MNKETTAKDIALGLVLTLVSLIVFAIFLNGIGLGVDAGLLNP